LSSSTTQQAHDKTITGEHSQDVHATVTWNPDAQATGQKTPERATVLSQEETDHQAVERDEGMIVDQAVIPTTPKRRGLNAITAR
jgi:hypothetical protein